MFACRNQMSWPSTRVLRPILDGATSTCDQHVHQKQPVRLTKLTAALAALTPLAINHPRKKALLNMLLSHNCLLRNSELRAITWGHIHLSGSGTSTVTIPATADKTNKRGKPDYPFLTAPPPASSPGKRKRIHNARTRPDRVLVLPTAAASPLLPYLFALRSIEQPTPATPFCPWRTYQQWYKEVKSAAAAHAWGDVGTQSFRAGGATDLFQGAAPESLVRRHGRWKSDVVQMYNRPLQSETAVDVTTAFRLAALGGARPEL